MHKKKQPQPSDFLRDCMAGAVMRLLEQYPIDKIQVKQICDTSGYHRASWFRAFRSKHEAVTYYMVRLWQNYCQQHGVPAPNDFRIEQAEAFFQYNYGGFYLFTFWSSKQTEPVNLPDNRVLTFDLRVQSYNYFFI